MGARAEVGAAFPPALEPRTPPGMVRLERLLVGHVARVVLAPEQAALAPAAWAELAETAAALDAGVGGSDMARLTPDGRPQPVSPRVFGAVARTLDLCALSDGACDPTRRPGSDRPAGLWREVALARDGRTVLAPVGVRLDLGALFGALATEAALAALARRGVRLVLVQVDDCVACVGTPGRPWAVSVRGHRRCEVLSAGALAASAGGAAVARAPTAAAAAAAAMARTSGARARRPRLYLVAGHGRHRLS